MTYSIVARDPETGALGVGVETHQPCVGAIVPWIKSGVGAVATQAFANIAFGPQALALLESGLPGARVISALIAADDLPTRRQLAVLPARGEPAVHTGNQCIPFAAHHVGEHYAVQANMMLNDTVPGAMAAAFEGAAGHLGERILAALEAAQGEGGDIRGCQSAALLVRSRDNPLDFHWDLRVDNDPQPLAKLRELVNIRLAGRALAEAESAAREAGDAAARAALLDAGFAKANGLASSDEQTFWFALTGLAQELGDSERALALIEPVFSRAPQWRELLFRLEQPGLEPLKAAVSGR